MKGPRAESVGSPRGAPAAVEWELEGRGKQCFLAVPSAELVVVGLQQGLGDVPLLTAGQVLAGALLLWLTTAAAATAATRQVGVVLRVREAGGGQS